MEDTDGRGASRRRTAFVILLNSVIAMVFAVIARPGEVMPVFWNIAIVAGFAGLVVYGIVAARPRTFSSML